MPNILDHLEHAEPAIVRGHINRLTQLQHAHRVEKDLGSALEDAILLLKSYTKLLDAMYLDSLRKGGGGESAGAPLWKFPNRLKEIE